MNKGRFYILLFLLAVPLKKGFAEAMAMERNGWVWESFLSTEKDRPSEEKTIYPKEFILPEILNGKNKSLSISFFLCTQIFLVLSSLSFRSGLP